MKIVAMLLLGVVSYAQPYELMRVPPANKGEELSFKLSYGWFTIGKGSIGPITKKLQTAYLDLVSGRRAGPDEWFTIVS